LTHLFVLLDEEAQVEARFGLFGDSANLDARLVHGLHGTYHMLGNQFGCTCWYFSEEAHVEARIDLFGDSANQDARLVHDLQGTYHMLRNQFGRTQWNS